MYHITDGEYFTTPPDTITTTLTEHHRSVLMPCDTSARLLELLLMLDQHWEFARLRVPICLVSRTGKEMVTLIRSLVEWMNPAALMDDDDTGTATLKFKCVASLLPALNNHLLTMFAA